MRDIRCAGDPRVRTAFKRGRTNANATPAMIGDSVGIAPQLSLTPLRSLVVNISHERQTPVQISWRSDGIGANNTEEHLCT